MEKAGSRVDPVLGVAIEQDVNIGTKKYKQVVCMGICNDEPTNLKLDK